MSPLAQLILYWLVEPWGVGHSIQLTAILPSALSDPMDRARLAWECSNLRISVPSDEEVLQEVQRLIDSGHLVASVTQGRAGVTHIPHLPARDQEFGEVLLATTGDALDVAGDVRAAVAAEALKMNEIAHYSRAIRGVAEREVGFTPWCPRYLPVDFAVKPEVVCHPDLDALTITYYSASEEFRGPRLILEQSTQSLAHRWPPGEKRRQLIGGGRTEVVSVGSNWKILVCSFEIDGLNARASFVWSQPDAPSVHITKAMQQSCVRIMRNLAMT